MPSYDAIPDFGLLYDSVPLYAARHDIAFYMSEASSARGRVLEIGCGTGRILLPIARTGCDIVGVDSSAEMLARCKSKVEAESTLVRDRVALCRGDIRTLEVGDRFALIIVPFRVFQHLTTIDDQLAALNSIRRHLAPGGRLVFDVFNPNFRALVSADGTEREDTPEHQLPDGRTFRRTARVTRVRWLDQVSEIELIYYLSHANAGAPERYVHSFDMRWYVHAELLHLLARAGFEVQAVYGDFDRSELTDVSPEQIVCAVVPG